MTTPPDTPKPPEDMTLEELREHWFTYAQCPVCQRENARDDSAPPPHVRLVPDTPPTETTND